MPQNVSKRRSSIGAGFAETSPLLVGVVGISIPVGLVAWAAVTKSTILLIFAVLGMFAVGAATLAFIIMLASDGDEPDNSGEPEE
ncbi:MAG: hypothetical protein ACRDK7_14335 [Solirubrobacteraceae bacterium]